MQKRNGNSVRSRRNVGGQTSNRNGIEKLVVGAVLTALVVILQYFGQFIHLGPFSISLVLIPIVIGAATGGTAISTWLGFVFGLMVLATDAGAFLAISVPGTVITVLLKGTACGFVSGVVYNLTKKKSEYLAVYMSAIVCPIVNTGIFLLGCVIFFFDTIKGWGVGAGYGSTVEYMFLGLAGGNFIFELITNLLLSPTVVFLTKMKNQIFKR
jgi:uncharacterized membrane protein